MSGKNTMSIYDLSKKPIAWIDISTYCNAGCPQCHRTDPNGLGKIGWLPLIQWSFESFKKAWTIENLNAISQFEICGTWGDPLMCKDIYKICEYIIKESDVSILMNTNGGMRDDDFWWELGLLGNKNRMQIIFDVEGINQEMHSHYRRKVNFEKLKQNIQSFTAAGGNALAHVIVFKHNEDYIEQILDMCYNELDMTHHVVQLSNRFGESGKEEYIDEKGNPFILEESSLPVGDPRFELPAPHRDHKWWKEKGHALVLPHLDTERNM